MTSSESGPGTPPAAAAPVGVAESIDDAKLDIFHFKAAATAGA